MMKRLLLAAAAGLVLASAGAQSREPVTDEAAIQQVEQTWVRATAKGDKAVLDRLLDNSYVETTANGQRRSKSDVLVAPPPAPGSSQTLADVEVRFNGDTAVVTGVNQYRHVATDEPQNYTFTDVFVRRDGTWRAIASQSSRY
ncbi:MULTISPECIES: nuclear transport factor 2 family protein [unclassified Paraburkholderia]|uniref:nuclear transport factor 2 family protein n=1 Tax=unclassified Paraburkholderia TaxID=2615204 RepID=UPI002AB75680|nr:MULTISPECIES: nuclear transport factor 2 family protein [unclassified Paraburkholderia]